jgi:hypothetical protein
LGLPSGLFPSGFPTITLYTPLSSPSALHALPISFLSIITHTILGEYGSLITSLWSLLHSPVTLPFL